MKIRYSPELRTLLDRPSNSISRYGVSFIFMATIALLISLQFVESQETCAVIFTMNSGAQHYESMTFDSNAKTQDPLFLGGTISFPLRDFHLLQVGQDIIFTGQKVKGQIGAIRDTTVHQDKALVLVVIKLRSKADQKKLNVKDRELTALFVYKKVTLAQRLLDHILHNRT